MPKLERLVKSFSKGRQVVDCGILKVISPLLEQNSTSALSSEDNIIRQGVSMV